GRPRRSRPAPIPLSCGCDMPHSGVIHAVNEARQGGRRLIMLRKSLLATVALAALSVPGVAQEVTSDLVVVDGEAVATSELVLPDGEQKAVTPTCSGGIVYDDGSLNAGYALSSGGQRA